MAFGDGHLPLALAHILSRGQHLAMQPGQLSISPFGGPDPLAFPCQQLPNMLDSSSADTFWDADCQFSATSMASTPCSPSCWAPVNKLTTCTASPGTRSSSSCATPAQRSLAAALKVLDSSAAAAPAAAGQAEQDPAAEEESCSTPRAQMIPAVRTPPGAPRTPRPAARALLPDRSSGLLRAHAGARLQLWLSQMELKLAVPSGPESPTATAQHTCLPHKATAGSSSAQQRAALTVTAAGAAAREQHGLSRPGAAAFEQPSAPTCRTPHPGRSSAGQLLSHSSDSSSANSSSISCPFRAKKRTLNTLSALDTLSAGGSSSAQAAGCCSGEGVAAPSVRNSKRRSADGVSSAAAAATPASAAAAAAAAGWQLGVTAAPASPFGLLAPSNDDLPAPAFEILGLLSGLDAQP